MEKFSPGPWRYCGQDRDQCKCGQVWSMKQDFNVAECFQSTEGGEITSEQQMANARLIAAAPEMYELLKALLEDGNVNNKLTEQAQKSIAELLNKIN